MRKVPNFLPRRMNLGEACSPGQINSVVRRALLLFSSIKCSSNRFIHIPPSAAVSHSIHFQPTKGRDHLLLSRFVSKQKITSPNSLLWLLSDDEVWRWKQQRGRRGRRDCMAAHVTHSVHVFIIWWPAGLPDGGLMGGPLCRSTTGGEVRNICRPKNPAKNPGPENKRGRRLMLCADCAEANLHVRGLPVVLEFKDLSAKVSTHFF